MDPHRAFVRHVAFPLQEVLKRHRTLRILDSLDKTQWLTPNEIRAHQVRDLRDFLSRIGSDVPYYRELFAKAGFDPTTADHDALAALPLLDKDTIRANTERLRSERPEAMQRSNTGGSTGSPLIFWLTRERVSHDVAAKLRSFEWWDVTFGDREAVVWGAPHELNSQDRVRRLRDRLFRSTLIPAFEMGDAHVAGYIERLTALKPSIVFGYPSAIALIAERALRDGLALDRLGTKVVFCTAEQLYPHQRERIGEAFGCPVANGYGARDAGFIAHECPQGSLHVTAEDIVVETVDASGARVPAGAPGEIVVTHLRNTGFPFVRYRTGDLGVLSDAPCPCGRGLPVLAEVTGRTTDFVYARNGERIHALALIYVLRDIPEVREFRILQTSLTHTEIQVDATLDQATLEAAIVPRFKAILGAGTEVEIRRVSPIPRDATGKFRYVRSSVSAGDIAALTNEEAVESA